MLRSKIKCFGFSKLYFHGRPSLRAEKSTLSQTPHPFPCSKKDISLYKDNTGLVQQPDKIVVRYALTIYPYSFWRKAPGQGA